MEGEGLEYLLLEAFEVFIPLTGIAYYFNFIIFIGFAVIPGGTQELFLALCSGMRTGVSCMQDQSVPYPLYYLSSIIFYFKLFIFGDDQGLPLAVLRAYFWKAWGKIWSARE